MTFGSYSGNRTPPLLYNSFARGRCVDGPLLIDVRC